MKRKILALDLPSAKPPFESSNKMASFLLTTSIGAVLNATSFIGGSYLASYLTGKNQDEEEKRHDLAMEKYEKDYNDWKARMEKVAQWKEDREEKQGHAARKFRSTEEAFRLFREQHPSEPENGFEEPKFSNYYKPSKEQRNGEMIFTGLAAGGLTFAIAKFV